MNDGDTPNDGTPGAEDNILKMALLPDLMEMQKALADLQQHKAEIMEMQKEMADLRYNKYREHKLAGFTDAQALELCKMEGFL